MASNVNYPMAATYALLMFGELLDDPRYTLRSKELLLVPTVLVSDRFLFTCHCERPQRSAAIYSFPRSSVGMHTGPKS